MSNHTAWPGFASALALLVAACAGDQPTDPGSLDLARGGNSAPLTVTPGSLSFLLPSGTTSATVTARVQFVGVITAASSDADCATVSPQNLPATKPPGSSVYVATFTVTATGPGDCTVTLTDKRGGTAIVQVQVRELPPVDGTRLLYSFSEEVLNENIYSSNPDGTGRVQVTDEEGAQVWAVFTPDRSKIVYVSQEAGSLNIFRANPDGTGKEQMTFYDIGTHVGAGTLTPAVSPDGQQIAFSLSTGINLTPIHIHVMDNVPGAVPVAVTAGDSENLSPTWTPDGRIVFTSNPVISPDGFNHAAVWIMDANGANLAQLTDPGDGSHRAPDVSPDGTTIAFVSRAGFGEPTFITLADIDGQNLRALTSVGSDTDPVFSPDGQWIGFVRTEDPIEGNNELYVLKLGRPESEAANITNSPDTNEFLTDWR